MLELKTPSPRRRLVHNRHGAPGQVKGATHERSELALDRPSTVALFEATKRGVIAHKKTTFFWTINTVAMTRPAGGWSIFRKLTPSKEMERLSLESLNASPPNTPGVRPCSDGWRRPAFTRNEKETVRKPFYSLDHCERGRGIHSAVSDRILRARALDEIKEGGSIIKYGDSVST